MHTQVSLNDSFHPISAIACSIKHLRVLICFPVIRLRRSFIRIRIAIHTAMGAGVILADVFAYYAAAGLALAFVFQLFIAIGCVLHKDIGLVGWGIAQVFHQCGILRKELYYQPVVYAAIMFDAIFVQIQFFCAGSQGQSPFAVHPGNALGKVIHGVCIDILDVIA